MPAFTALGAYIATSLATAGAFAVGSVAFVAVQSIVAIGAAYVTSRLINGNANKGGLDSGGAGGQGGRIQIPPATNNKIPVVYGSAFVNGMITDAYLTTTDQKKNDTMYYCLVLSETCNMVGAAYTVDDIYWNDLRLTFETGAGLEHKVLDGRKTVDGPGEDFINSDFKVDGTNFVEIRVYAGNSQGAQQIFPLQSTGNTANAWDYWPDTQWTSANQMEGLVFAVIKLKYNAEKGFTNLPTVTFKLTNNKSNPAQVWFDYMTSRRYGAGVDPATIPVGSGSDYEKWFNYCEELIRYTDKDAVSTTQKRYQINGVIDTSNSVKANIDSIVQNGGAWMSYDVVTGYWRPIIKKAITAGDPTVLATHFTGSVAGTTLTVTAFPEGRIEPGQSLYLSNGTLVGTIVSQSALGAGEQQGQIGTYTISASTTIGSTTFYTTAANLLQFDDNNIIGGISISSTRLDDLYNKYEAEFFDKYNKDQRAYARDELPSGLRNPQEPDNQLRISLEFTNNSVQANILSNIELRQSRDDLIIEFTASHYGIQAEAGDVIKVVNSIYGWAPKLFRVMRVKEVETEEGGLIVNIQALEYNGDVYTIEPLTEFTTEANIGIPPVATGGTSGNIQTPDNNLVSVVETNNTSSVPFIVLSVQVPITGGPYEVIEVWYAESPTATVPVDNAYTRLMTHKPPPPASVYNNGRSITVTSITGGDTLNTSTAHNLQAGDQLLFASTSSNGLLANRGYWVLSSGLTSTAFKLALTENGAPIALTNGTGLSLVLHTCHLIYITNLPANQSGQKYFFRVRVGSGGYYSALTDADVSLPITNPSTPYNPYGGGSINLGSGVSMDLTGAIEGNTIYYDATTSTWKDTTILRVNDVTNAVELAGNIQLGGTNPHVGIAGLPYVRLSSTNVGDVEIIDDLTVGGDIRVNGGDIRNDSGNVAITMGTGLTPLTTLGGDLRINGGLLGPFIRGNDNTNHIQLQGAGNVKVMNDLTIGGNDILASDNNINITLTSNTLTTFAGDIRISGNDIQSSTGATAISLSGSDVVVQGDLTVQGTTTTLNTQNLYVEDNIVTLNYGAVSPSLNAGIEVNRGVGNFVPAVRWNESTDKWQFSNDGTTYTDLGVSTTYDFNATSTTGGANLNLVGSDLTTDTVKLSNGTGVTVSRISGTEVSVAIGQAVGTGDNPSFAGVTGGNITVGVSNDNTITTTSGNLTLASATGIVSCSDILGLPSVEIDTGTLNTTTTTANQTLDTTPRTRIFFDHVTIKYLVSIRSGTERQSVEILVVQDGTTAYHTVYADVKTGADLATFNVIVSGTDVLLRTTPTNANTRYAFKKELIYISNL